MLLISTSGKGELVYLTPKLRITHRYMDGGPVLTRRALEKKEKLPESLARQYFRDMLKVCVKYSSVAHLKPQEADQEEE